MALFFFSSKHKKSLGKISEGQKIAIIGETPDSYEISFSFRMPEGWWSMERIGWISKDLLTRVDPQPNDDDTKEDPFDVVQKWQEENPDWDPDEKETTKKTEKTGRSHFAKATKSDLGIPEDEELYNFKTDVDSVKGSYTTTGDMNVTNIHTESMSNGKIKVDMDIYNKASVPGVLQILDDNGNVVNSIWLGENQFAASSAWDMTEYVFRKAVDNFIDGVQRIGGKTDVEYDNASASTWTKIRGLEIPSGTHIRITNSIDQSEDLQAYYIASNCYDGFMQMFKIANYIAQDDLDDLTGHELSGAGKRVLKDIVKDFAKNFKEEAPQEFFLQGATDQVKAIGEAFAKKVEANPQEIWDAMKDALKEKGGETFLKTAFNMTAKAATATFLSPAVEKAIGGVFDVMDTLNFEKSVKDGQKYRDAKPLHYYFYTEMGS